MAWEYEPDQIPKKKHHWNNNFAGFLTVNGKRVSKCPNSITTGRAKQALNEGIEWSPKRWKRQYPQRIYNIIDGIVYRAMPTIPGKSYHGFPVPPDEFNDARLKNIFNQLVDLSVRLGCEKKFNYWIKNGVDKKRE